MHVREHIKHHHRRTLALLVALLLIFGWMYVEEIMEHNEYVNVVLRTRSAIAESREIRLSIPSFAQSHTRIVRDQQSLQRLAESIDFIECECHDPTVVTASGGNSIVVTIPTVLGFELTVGSGFAIICFGEPDVRQCYFCKTANNELLRECAKVAGFAYPLMSDVHVQ